MKIYLKSCSLYEVKKAVDYGLIDGVNLISEDTLEPCIATDNDKASIAGCIPGPIFVNICGETADEILDNARRSLGFAPNAVVKFKASLEGLKACRILSDNNISVSMDNIRNTVEAVLCARSGADYISLNTSDFLTKASIKSEPLTQCCMAIKNYGYDSVVIADKVSMSDELQDVFKSGVDAISVTYENLMGLMKKEI